MEEVSGTRVSKLCERGMEPQLTLIGFDRDLGVAGRVMVRANDGSIQQKLVKVDRPSRRYLSFFANQYQILTFPSLAHPHPGHSSGTQGII